jgi:hypothetical protein
VQREQYLSLHSLELVEGVAAVSDLDVVLHAGRVDLLILAGDPQTGNSNQLVLLLVHLRDRAVLVEVGQGQLQGLLLELEGGVHVHQPVDEDLPHVGRYGEQKFFFLASLDRVGGT